MLRIITCFSILMIATASYIVMRPPTQIKIQGNLVKPALKLNHFSLQDQHGHSFSRKDLKNHWSLLFFGFTHCAMICPTTMTALDDMSKILNQKKVIPPQVVFVSIDPERDNTNRLRTYLSYFNSQFIGLTGSDEDIERLKTSLGVLSFKMQASEQYTLDHSSQIYVVNPNAAVVASLDYPHHGAQLATDVIQIMSALP